jgi:hypothetical protein
VGDHDSYSDSLELWHEFAEIHSLNRGACASNVATMLPTTLQFLIAMIACAINERMQRKLDYTQEEVRVLKEIVAALMATVGSRSPRISVVG